MAEPAALVSTWKVPLPQANVRPPVVVSVEYAVALAAYSNVPPAKVRPLAPPRRLAKKAEELSRKRRDGPQNFQF